MASSYLWSPAASSTVDTVGKMAGVSGSPSLLALLIEEVGRQPGGGERLACRLASLCTPE